MPYIPDEIKIALDGYYADFKHEPLEIDIPPGDPAATVTFEPAKKNIIWQIYVMLFGELTPAGPTSDVWFKHWQVGVKPHKDPMVHSILDFPYPMWANCNKGNPHYIELHNLTDETQTVDLQIYMAVFSKPRDYAEWFSDLILMGKRYSVGREILKLTGMDVAEFEEVYEERKKELLRKRPDVMERFLPELKIEEVE